MLTRRQEVMACEALRTGKIVLVGDKYPAVTVDFQRDATLSPAALAGAALWSAGTATPLDNLRTWALLGLKKSGVFLTDVVMAVDVYQAFIANATVKARWQALNSNQLGTDSLLGAAAVEGAVYMGHRRVQHLRVRRLVRQRGGRTENEIHPSNWLTMSAPAAVEGVRAFGAIKDVEHPDRGGVLRQELHRAGSVRAVPHDAVGAADGAGAAERLARRQGPVSRSDAAARVGEDPPGS
jgi:hypothetical protein